MLTGCNSASLMFKLMVISITKSNKLRAAIVYSYCPAIDTSSASLNRNRTKIKVIAVLLRLLHLPKFGYVQRVFSEESIVL